MGKYFECHVTIFPVLEPVRFSILKGLAEQYSFHVADLLMRKKGSSRIDEFEPSDYDTFLTGRSYEYEELAQRMRTLVVALVSNNFNVWRMKIEEVIFDTKQQLDTKKEIEDSERKAQEVEILEKALEIACSRTSCPELSRKYYIEEAIKQL